MRRIQRKVSGRRRALSRICTCPTAISSVCTIPPYYDSMIAKLIVWAKNRKETIYKMQSALGEVVIEGVDTNVDYQYDILHHPDFLSGNINIGFIEDLEKGAGRK